MNSTTPTKSPSEPLRHLVQAMLLQPGGPVWQLLWESTENPDSLSLENAQIFDFVVLLNEAFTQNQNCPV